MPTPPKSRKPAAQAAPDDTGDEVIVWNRGHMNDHGNYSVGVYHLHYTIANEQGKPTQVTTPILPGLCVVGKHHWDRAVADAEKCPTHGLNTARAEKRLSVVKLESMSLEQGCTAIDQTASKAILAEIGEGKRGAPVKLQAHALKVRAEWGDKGISKIRKITNHFAGGTNRLAV